MKNKKVKILFALLFSLLIFISCNKSKQEYEEQRKESVDNPRTSAYNANRDEYKEIYSNNLDFLKDLNGKYPNDVRLFDNPDFTARLKYLLGDRYEFLVNTWDVESPIEIVDDLFIAEACMAHNCGATNFIIIYDFSTDIFYVGIREEFEVELYSDDGSSIPRLLQWAE